jgi:hypothetical protein
MGTVPASVADMFVDLDTDPLADLPTQAGERETLMAIFRRQRDTLVLKCVDLDAHQVAWQAIDCSFLSLLGLVRHRADDERSWFGRKAPARTRWPVADGPHSSSRRDVRKETGGFNSRAQIHDLSFHFHHPRGAPSVPRLPRSSGLGQFLSRKCPPAACPPHFREGPG